MKILFSLLLICITSLSFSQTDQQQINEQVWKPFTSSYEKLDLALFMSIQSKDLMRVAGSTGGIQNFEDYETMYKNLFNNTKSTNASISISFRFIRRVSDEKRAMEEGIYKFSRKTDKGTGYGYGKFLVILKKEEGRWKIVIDTDISEGITEKDYAAARPIDEK